MSADASAYRLAVVGAGRVRGQVAMVGCPGRVAGMALPTSSAWRLQRDLATLRHWRAQALITLLEDAELATLRLGQLPELLAAHRIAWCRIPLREGCIPDQRFETTWCAVAPRLRAVLWCGGRIAVHCMDGRSRTAMVTAKLLIELGCPVQDALNRVRGARPGLITTPEEEHYVRRQTAAAEAVYRTQVSLAQLRTAGGEEESIDWTVASLVNPRQLDLLRPL